MKLQIGWNLRAAAISLGILSLSACAVNLEEARATARVAELPPVDIDVSSCNGLNMKECNDDLSDQFNKVAAFWGNQSKRWAESGLQQEQEGQELIVISNKISAMTAEASVFFKNANADEKEKNQAKFTHYMAVYQADRHRISSLAVARLQLKNASAVEVNARRSRIAESLRHLGSQQNQEVDVHVHQD